MFPLKYLNMTKIFYLNYDNIPGQFHAITMFGFWTLPLLIFLKMFFRILLRTCSVKNVESFLVVFDAVPINIFKDYSNLKHLNKCNGNSK